MRIVIIVLLLVSFVGTRIYGSHPNVAPRFFEYAQTEGAIAVVNFMENVGVPIDLYGKSILLCILALTIVLVVFQGSRVKQTKRELKRAEERHTDDFEVIKILRGRLNKQESEAQTKIRALESQNRVSQPDSDKIEDQLKYLQEEALKLQGRIEHANSEYDDENGESERIALLRTNLSALAIAVKRGRCEPIGPLVSQLEELERNARQHLTAVTDGLDTNVADKMKSIEASYSAMAANASNLTVHDNRLGGLLDRLTELDAELLAFLGKDGLVEELRRAERMLISVKARYEYLKPVNNGQGQQAPDINARIALLTRDIGEIERSTDRLDPAGAAQAVKNLEKRLGAIAAQLGMPASA